MSVVGTVASRRCQVGVAVGSGLILGETGPAEEFEDKTSQRHEDGHAHAQSYNGRHIRFQPGTVWFYIKTDKILSI